MNKIINIKYEIDKQTKRWKNLIYDGYIFDSPIALIRYCIEQGKKEGLSEAKNFLKRSNVSLGFIRKFEREFENQNENI